MTSVLQGVRFSDAFEKFYRSGREKIPTASPPTALNESAVLADKPTVRSGDRNSVSKSHHNKDLRGLMSLIGVLTWTLAFTIAGVDAGGVVEIGGGWQLVHPSPVMQSITRTAFVHPPFSDRFNVYFSTLESYHRQPGEPDRFVFARYRPDLNEVSPVEVAGAIEARVSAFAPALGQYVLGTSLEPSLLLYDADRHATTRTYSFSRTGAWIHGLAVRGEHAYTILSSPTDASPSIVSVNLRSGAQTAIPVPPSATGWAGVQTVDPTGRIWWFRNFHPTESMWFDVRGGARPRLIAGYEGWTPESWDVWRGREYVTLSRPPNLVQVVAVDLATLRPRDAAASDAEEALFRSVVRVDLFHSADDSAGALYVNPGTSEFYRRLPATDRLQPMGRMSLGRFLISSHELGVQEHPVRWLDEAGAEINVLGADADGRLLTWRRGARQVGVFNPFEAASRGPSWQEQRTPPVHLSTATITALVGASDGSVVGAGLLTMSDMFAFDPGSDAVRALEQAIPGGEGQVNTLFSGMDGRIYGAGYPDVVLFRWDPGLPWQPGANPDSNPRHLPPLGHGPQMRASRGIQDRAGRIWVQSTSDYSEVQVHAVTRANFDSGEVIVRTDTGHDFPVVTELALLGPRLIAAGSRRGQHALYVIDPDEFRIVRTIPVAQPVTALVNTAPAADDGLVLASAGRMVFSVTPDGDLLPVAEGPGDVLRLIAGPEGSALMIGQTFVARLPAQGGGIELLWSEPGATLFEDPGWLAAAVSGDVLYVARGQALWKLMLGPPPRQ